ncbi:hypothetical protein LINPERPRIM_LOCUS12420 [Linum perenne]
MRFRELLNGVWIVEMKHIFREGNKAVDYLGASLGYERTTGLHLISCFDSGIHDILLYESLGRSEPCSISINR